MKQQKSKDKITPPAHWFDRWCVRLFGNTIDFSKLHLVAENNFKVGLKQLALGNLRDAILRFKMVTWFEPHHKLAWYQLGRAQLKNNLPHAAARAFRRAMKLDPKNEEAAYFLAIALGSAATANELPRKMPAALAIAHFDSLAAEYSNEQAISFKYKGHVLLPELLKANTTKGRTDHVILDLGCGSGLASEALRPMASKLIGVDFSGKMLDEAMKLEDAANNKLYDALIKREAHEYLRESAAEAYDMVLCANTISYIGDAKALFAQIAQAMKPGGLFAVSAEKLDAASDFRFKPGEGRFYFSKAYLAMAGELAGLKLLKCEEENLYPNEPHWLAVFRK